MKSTLTLLLIIFLAFAASGQSEKDAADLNLDFEKISDNTKLPDKWLPWGQGFDLKVDNTEKKSGNASVSMEPAAQVTENSFGAIGYRIPAAYAGKEIELRGFLKLKDVSGGFAGLLMRIDGEGGPLQFDNMQTRNLGGSSDWTQYSIKLPLPEEAASIYVGAVLIGKGKVWVDDLQILIDGKDIREAKLRPLVVTKAALDKEFDKGSEVDALKLDRSRTEDLAVLGKGWGILKY